MNQTSNIILAIELQCRGSMHDAGALIRAAVHAHCDGQFDEARQHMDSAILYCQSAKRLIGRQPARSTEPPSRDLL